jgi:hypothetical protein
MIARVIGQGKIRKQQFLVYSRKSEYNKKEIGNNSPTYRGMRTPGLHLISRSPKNSVPSIYCRGSPLARLFTYCCKRCLSLPVSACCEATTSAACSPSHLSSFRDDCKSLQTGRRGGNRRSIRRAWRRSVGGMRGMRSRSRPQRGRIIAHKHETGGVLTSVLRWWRERKAASSRGTSGRMGFPITAHGGGQSPMTPSKTSIASPLHTSFFLSV